MPLNRIVKPRSYILLFYYFLMCLLCLLQVAVACTKDKKKVVERSKFENDSGIESENEEAIDDTQVKSNTRPIISKQSGTKYNQSSPYKKQKKVIQLSKSGTESRDQSENEEAIDDTQVKSNTRPIISKQSGTKYNQSSPYKKQKKVIQLSKSGAESRNQLEGEEEFEEYNDLRSESEDQEEVEQEEEYDENQRIEGEEEFEEDNDSGIESEDEEEFEQEEEYDENQRNCEILPETTPLVFQWYPKEYNQLILDRHNHKERLIAWSKREPQRPIYLVVHGAGLSPEKMEELKAMFNGYNTIHIVDFDKLNLGSNDFTLKICTETYKISKWLKYRYKEKQIKDNIPDNIKYIFQQFHKYISMGCWIDLMRITMLLSIKEITGGSEALYMDLDFQLGKKGKCIGCIRLPRGIALADGKENTQRLIENGAFALGKKSEPILNEMVNAIKALFLPYNLPDENINPDAVYGAMRQVIEQKIARASSNKSEEKYYIIQKNGGNITLQQDSNSWK